MSRSKKEILELQNRTKKYVEGLKPRDIHPIHYTTFDKDGKKITVNGTIYGVFVKIQNKIGDINCRFDEIIVPVSQIKPGWKPDRSVEKSNPSCYEIEEEKEGD